MSLSQFLACFSTERMSKYRQVKNVAETMMGRPNIMAAVAKRILFLEAITCPLSGPAKLADQTKRVIS